MTVHFEEDNEIGDGGADDGEESKEGTGEHVFEGFVCGLAALKLGSEGQGGNGEFHDLSKSQDLDVSHAEPDVDEREGGVDCDIVDE